MPPWQRRLDFPLIPSHMKFNFRTFLVEFIRLLAALFAGYSGASLIM